MTRPFSNMTMPAIYHPFPDIQDIEIDVRLLLDSMSSATALY